MSALLFRPLPALEVAVREEAVEDGAETGAAVVCLGAPATSQAFCCCDDGRVADDAEEALAAGVVEDAGTFAAER